MPEPVGDVRALFAIPDDVTYLNCAYMSPQLRSVSKAGQAAVLRKARPWEIATEDFFADGERYRALAARLVGCKAEDIAIVPSVSYGIACAVANLPLGPGRGVVVLTEQFPSNVYPWQAASQRQGAPFVFVPRPREGGWTRAVLQVLSARDDLAVAALPGVHWADGSRLDLEVIGAACRERGVRLVLDLTQSLGAEPFDVGRVPADFVVAAGYKWLLGPYGLGLMYVAPGQQDGRPVEEAWMNRAGSDDFAGLVRYREDYLSGARRFDMGERAQFVALPMAIAALEQLLAWGVPAIADTTSGLIDMVREFAAGIGLGVPAAGEHARHMIGLGLPAGAGASVLRALAAARVYASVRGDALRISPHVYNAPGDVGRLREALEQVLREGAGAG